MKAAQSNSPKKSLGQHWLHDANTLDEICDYAEIKPEDTVLEIGPGLGTLTERIAALAERVVAVEFDDDLAKDLLNKISANNVEVINQDILSFDYEQMPSGYKVVANIPYYLTSRLLRELLEANNKPSQIVLLIQKEVAERVAAKPGKLSILGVSAQYYAEVSLGMVVQPHLFTPPPKVDSQVLILKPHSEPLFTDVDDKLFFRMVKAGFSEKRKKLSNALSGSLQQPKDDIQQILEVAGFNPNIRAQELTLPEWYKLYKVLMVK